MLRAFANKTDGPPVAYTGVDIVRSLVDRNRRELGGARARFLEADVAYDVPLGSPWADLVFSRQMTQHMCSDDARRFLRLVSRSGARFALLTTFETDEAFANADIPCDSGGYRPQDLTKPPYGLPPPLRFFSERYPLDGRVGLGLWHVPTLRRRLR